MKNILSVIAGLILGFLAVLFSESICQKMYPFAAGIDFSKADRETLTFIMGMVPLGAFMTLLAGYAFGSFFGGLVAFLISGNKFSPITVGGIIMVGGIINLVMIPHPLWFIVISQFMYVPFSLAGGKIGSLIKKRHHK